MKVVIAGSRHLEADFTLLDTLVPLECTHVVCGEARGVDTCGRIWAEHSEGIEVISCPAEWNKYGKKAGYIRNRQMAEIADCLVLIWDGESKGSKSMKKLMEDLGKPVIEKVIK